ncbi:hypothetical protein ACB094_06G005700 [Castanea mollissima]
MTPITLTLFLWLLTIATLHPKLCSGEFEVCCIESERQALLKFKQDLEDPLNRLASWATADEGCWHWLGVVCHNLTGHVYQLHLRSVPPSDDQFTTDDQYGAQLEAYKRSRFVGKINPSLLDLKYLTYLDLSYNDFCGTQIPKFFGSMGSLRYLNLSNARFGGMVPHQLGNLSNMHYLDLGGNYGYNLYVQSLQWLSSLPLLQHLDLSYVTNKLPSLLKMWLSGCYLGFTPLIPNINFSSLTTLDLSSTTLENNLIPKWVFGLHDLVSLDLSSIGFHGSIPVDLQNMTSLRHLDLSYNFLNSSIPNWLNSFRHLEFLNLGSNNFQGIISSAIGNLTSAIRIDFSGNELNRKVPRSLGYLCNLREIRFSYNKWNQKIFELLESLSRCVSHGLETLEMNDARLSGHLINELGQFKNPVVLSLGYNLISGPIPWSIGNLSSLRSLNLEANQINETLPQCFGQLSKLEYLNIDSNILEGVVSKVHFANLMRLTTLVASRNRLTLEASDKWVPPFQLNALYLRSWILGPKSKFPLWFCSQKHLEFLDISNTGISDVIPHLFWNMSSQFTYLNISHNHIHGNIPHIPMLLSMSSVIDMSSNQFIGSLPYISSNVSFLDLSDNKLSGSISHFLKNLLSGEISDCWELWQSLFALNLGNNNFIGSIPISNGSLDALSYLHLQDNKFSGKIPLALKNCRQLVTTDIAKNEFVGSIPSWMGYNLSKLAILNLHSNNFHGYIPKELCFLTSLQIFDLSNNKPFGSIPKCVYNFSSMTQATYHNSNHPFLLFQQSLGYNSIPFESELLVIKGKVLEYSTTLQMVKIIDFSKNYLSVEIPREVTSLTGLQSLNLSFNFLTRRIPQNIGDMRSLESIDFSINQLSGQVPESMSSLTFLSHLNLSNNKLTGRIPSSTQLQSLNESPFSGNKLCGPPLTNNCTIRDVKPISENKWSKHFHPLKLDWFYVSMALGFVVGFWVVLGPLLLYKQWRIMYFQFLDHLGYKLWSVVAQTW